MNKDIKQLWITALRSGKYKQGKDVLRTQKDEFCCLGVLCDVLAKEGLVDFKWNKTLDDDYYFDDERLILPLSIQVQCELIGEDVTLPESVDFLGHNLKSLTSLNDTGADFELIASVIEKQL